MWAGSSDGGACVVPLMPLLLGVVAVVVLLALALLLLLVPLLVPGLKEERRF